MKLLIITLSLMVSQLALAQDITYGGDGYEIQILEPEVKVKPVPVKVEPVQKVKTLPKKKIAPRKPAQVTPPEDEAIISLTTTYYQGGIYFGGEKVPADFTYVGVDLLFPSQGWFDFGLSGGYLFNKSAVKVFNGNLYLGYKYKINDQWTFRAGPQIGFSLYNEQTTIQQVTAFGLHLGAKVQVDYTFKSGLFVGAGLNWRHDMYATSYWGKDPFSDVVLDFIGPQLSIGWKF